MDHLAPARQRFLNCIKQADPEVPLAAAALALAWEDQGGVDREPWLAHFDTFATNVAPMVNATSKATEQIAALNTYLFDTIGFYGDPSCYRHPDPAHSYLDQVIERRTGLPIMLALIYLETGWRLGLPVHGLALPGHFMVRFRDPAGDHFVDPFSGGSIWSMADCERQIATFYGTVGDELSSIIMAPPGRGAILARILRNLKQTHLARGDSRRALTAVERLLLLDASDPGELRDRGLLRLRTGQLHAAITDLEAYVQRNPAANDISEIKRIAREVITQLVKRN